MDAISLETTMSGWEQGDWRNEDLCKFEESNLQNKMGIEFYDLSHPWGLGQPCWPYFEDVKIERLHGMSKSGVLTQRITTVMHSGTHIDAPAHVVQGTPFMDEVPLPYCFGTGVVVSIPKKKWEVITAKDLENARPQIRPGDIAIVNTGWHTYYGDNQHYYGYSPGFYKEAGEWFVQRKVKMCGSDTQALDHPLALPSARTVPALRMACCRSSIRNTSVRPDTRSSRIFPTGSPATMRSSRRASAASRTSAGTLTRSPAGA